jgi:hypothetical protein
MTGRVRRLVDAGKRGERDTRTMLADVAGYLGTRQSVDLEPSGDVSGEMRSRGPRGKRDATPDSIRSTKSTAYHAQRAKRRPGELEQSRCRRVEVTVDESHLRADVAPTIAESSFGFARSVEPP